MANKRITNSIGCGAIIGAVLGGLLIEIPLLGLAGTPKVSIEEGIVVAAVYALPGIAIGTVVGAVLGVIVAPWKK